MITPLYGQLSPLRIPTMEVPLPKTIPSLQIWLDASDSSTFYNATFGGSLVTTDGGAVARWEDKSGNNRHATQGTANARPILKTSIKNGKNVLRFDGSNDYLIGTSSRWTNQVTVFYVAKTNTATSYVFSDGTSTNADAFHFGWNGSKPSFYGNGWNNQNPRAVSGANNTGSFILVSSILGTSSSIFVNATTPINSVVTGGSLSQNTNFNFLIGHEGFWFFNGDISEVLIYNTVLTTNQRQSVEYYLNAKWAIY